MAKDTINTEVLESFMARARQASRLGSKELRIPMPEGYELAAAIGQIIARNLALVEQVRETEKLVGASLRVDGGKFA
jgi:hypothetical protein